MLFSNIKIFCLLFLFLSACDTGKTVSEPVQKESGQAIDVNSTTESADQPIVVGAGRLDQYLPFLEGKKIALVVNQTSRIGDSHLVDSLLSLGITIEKIFAPEHGFRGQADAGEVVKDGKDAQTNIPLVSLYGKNKKPSASMLAGLDLVVFDIQDVGVRFYTYISTMTYVMEACAESEVDVLVLDRPNPNGHYIDGPVLQKEYASFIGLHPVPVVHGMTVGEYAQMVNGEGWLKGGVQCHLEVIPCLNYSHSRAYELSVKPSPNLPNNRSIYLYPSLCFFEGTTVNIGRGTNEQFQVYGHPAYQGGDYQYTPQSMPGARSPKFKGKTCFGYQLSKLDPETIRQEGQLNLNYLINYYKTFPKEEDFFLKNNFFEKLAGGKELRQQILQGMDAETIRASWKADLETYRQVRSKYLLYDD